MRRNKLLNGIAVPHVALVGVCVLRFTALNGATSNNLTAVQKRVRLRVVKLIRGFALQHVLLEQTRDELVRDALVNFAATPNAAAFVD